MTTRHQFNRMTGIRIARRDAFRQDVLAWANVEQIDLLTISPFKLRYRVRGAEALGGLRALINRDRLYHAVRPAADGVAVVDVRF